MTAGVALRRLDAGRRLPPSLPLAGLVVASALALPIVVLVLRSVVDGALASALGARAVLAALGLSLATTATSLVLTVLAGLPLALVLARSRFRGKWLVEAF